ncbi:neuroglian [Biomphalaria glabrata]|nr:neuroglian-like [Biomphalaria glabrata]KAI8742828.1 neuroglian [Biomphalaria glabrata]
MTDVAAQEGDTAKFLCPITTLARNLGKNQITVYWTFGGRRIEIDPDMEEEGHYASKAFEGRQVLVINKIRTDDEGEYGCVVSVSDWTGKAVGKLTVLRAPDPPHDVRVISCYGNTAELSWQPGKSNGAEIQQFVLQYTLKEKPDTWFDFYDEVSGDKNTSYVEIPPYGTYMFRVLARNAVGVSRPSAVTSRECTTPPDRPDRNPINVLTKTDKKGFLVIEWEPLPRLLFHGPGFCYMVLWRRKGSLAWNSAVVNGTFASRYEHEVDEIYGLFEVQVKSKNDMGEAHQPAFIYLGRSFEAEPQVIISGFQQDPSRPFSANTAYFKWEHVDPEDKRMHGKFRGYKLLYWKWNDSENNKKHVFIPDTFPSLEPGSQFKAALSDLPAYSTFHVQVVVVNTHYHGPPSDTVQVFTPEGLPDAVQGLFAVTVTSDSVTLRWLPPDRPNGLILGYDIGYQIVTGNNLGPMVKAKSSSMTPTSLQARVDNLKPNVRYRFSIVGRTQAGKGDVAYIDVRTTNRTISAETSGSTLFRAHNDKPSAFDSSPENSSWSSRCRSYLPLVYFSALLVFHNIVDIL